jgi:FtsP/CotA-like multicopper oxidase with cupredoxin domain
MMFPSPTNRREFLLRTAGLGAALAFPRVVAAQPVREFKLVAAPARQRLAGPGHPDTAIWSYGGSSPGPELRVKRGETIRVQVENRLPEATTVHWHGIRLPNAMDGVPHLTQAPIAPGETFTYEFACPDSGTYWYHPHDNSDEQVGRGLYGALIVEEVETPPFDRDVTWVLGDWLLQRDGVISPDFGNMHDVIHDGRIGNTVTVNGRVAEEFAVRAGERIRLRLINAANARIFGLDFEGHAVRVIALDGQAVEPYPTKQVALGPGMRVDLLLDCTREPGSRFRVVDRFYRSLEYRLLDIAYGREPPLRDLAGGAPLRIAANAIPEPQLSGAVHHDIRLEGGMMGMMHGGGMMGGMDGMRRMMQQGIAWSINGISETEHTPKPLLTLKRGATCLLQIANDTAAYHPMHLHGHSYRLLSRNGSAVSQRPWQDTTLIAPRERVEVAFVADNPGDWMFHCHILEHQVGGMMGTIRVL